MIVATLQVLVDFVTDTPFLATEPPTTIERLSDDQAAFVTSSLDMESSDQAVEIPLCRRALR